MEERKEMRGTGRKHSTKSFILPKMSVRKKHWNAQKPVLWRTMNKIKGPSRPFLICIVTESHLMCATHAPSES